MRLGLVPLALALGAVACSSYDLPNDQLLTSAHFRYHARLGAVLDPTITDRLEAHRAGFEQRYGVAKDVTDYYLFRDPDDLSRTSPCEPRADHCTTPGGAVMAYAPFVEEELVRAYLADTGHPAAPVADGIARWEACLQPRLAPPVSWPASFSSDDGALGQRLVGWMTAQGPATQFIQFYSTDPATKDAASFSSDVEASWGQPIDALVPTLNTAAFAGTSCACAAPALSSDGTSVPLVQGQEYRVLQVAADSRFQISTDGAFAVMPRDCAGAQPVGPTPRSAHALPSMTIGRAGAGAYAVASVGGTSGRANVTAASAASGAPTCEAAMASPVAVDGNNVTLWVDRKVASTPTVFSLVLGGPVVVSNFSGNSAVTLCRGDCTTDCVDVGANTLYVDFTPSSDGHTTITVAGAESDRDVMIALTPP